MAYIKYKEVTKYFNFTKAVSYTELPKYTTDYVFDDERILVGYKTVRDYGIFTDSKIVLFDNAAAFGMMKQVFVIPYKSVSSISVIFKPSGGEITCMLDSGYPLRLKFVNMNNEDKLRLRLLYSCIIKVINNQVLDKNVVRKLMENDISFDRK